MGGDPAIAGGDAGRGARGRTSFGRRLGEAPAGRGRFLLDASPKRRPEEGPAPRDPAAALHLRLPARAVRPGVEVMPGRADARMPRLQATGNAGTAIAGYSGQHKETTRGRFHQPNTVPPTIEIVSGLNSNRTQPKSPTTTGVQPQPAHQLNGISPLWCPWRKRQGHFPDCKKVKLAMQEWAETPVPGSRQGPRPTPCQFGLYSV